MAIQYELERYCDDILTGRTLACVKLKWAAIRFLDDLERSGKDEFPYRFNEKKAENFLDFMRLFDHTKGPLAGTPKEPELIEKFLFGQCYGWETKDDNIRRFRTLYWSIARKNAKSQDAAIAAIYEAACMGESCSEVLIAATKKEQTKYVWEEADLIIKRCKKGDPPLCDRFETKYGIIRHIKSNSTIGRLSEEDRKKGDGSNPQCGILEEYHAHETDEFFNLLSSGMKVRKQPILMIITTAGFELNNPCYRDEYQYISKILNPDHPTKNDRYLVVVCEIDKDDETGAILDDIRDPNVWVKCAPILAKTKTGIASMRTELQVALDKQEKMKDFLTKSCNIWLPISGSAYMNKDRWNLCKGDFPSFTRQICISGADLSSKISLTSVSFEIKIDDVYYIISHSFMPAETLEQKIKTDRVPYDRWVREGWITATPGSIVDYRIMLKYIIEETKKFGWYLDEICIDPWGAVQIASDIRDAGYTPVEIRQSLHTLSEPTKDFRDQVYQKKVIHNGNPVLGWGIGNAIATPGDINNNFMLSKRDSISLIDPIAAVINSHCRAMVNDTAGSGGVFFV